MRRTISCLSVSIACIFFASLAFADMSVENGWVRVPPPAVDVAAAYMTLHNNGDQEMTITGVDSRASGSAGIHATEMQGDMMHMRRLNRLIIPAHGSVTLALGGMHIMLNDLKRELKPGQTVSLSLSFSDGGRMALDLPVRLSDGLQALAQQLYERGMALAGKGSYADASLLFRQSGEDGNRRAQYQLGLLYARGEGLKKDLPKARKWLYKAAMQGHPKAQFYLGQMYAFGDGGKKDEVEATMWFWIATTLGDRYARDSLRVMTGKISSQHLTKAKERADTLWKQMPHDMEIRRGSAMH